jgi:hypothetical protein
MDISIKQQFKLLPYGSGSIHMRGCTYWLVYGDAEGRRQQINSCTDNVAQARAMLIERSLRVLDDRRAVLEAALDEAKQAAGRADTSLQRIDGGGRSRGLRPPDGNASTNRGRNRRGTEGE